MQIHVDIPSIYGMSCKRNISRSGKFQFAPVLIVQTHKIQNFVEFPCGLCPAKAEERLMPDPTLDYYLLPTSLFSFQLFITSRQKINKINMLFRSSILIAFVLLNGTRQTNDDIVGVAVVDLC